MKKVLVPVAVVAVIAGAYIAYPYYCVNQLSAAVRSDDQARLSKLVDWSSVRLGLKADLIALMSQSVAQPASYNPGQALGQAVIEMLGPKVVDNIVASYATPAGLSGLIRNGGEIDMKAAVARTAASMAGGMALGSAGVSATAPKDTASNMPTDTQSAWGSGTAGGNAGNADAAADDAGVAQAAMPPILVKSTRFVGVNQMEVAFQDPDDTSKPAVRGILTLEGLRWKLTRIVLPVDEMLDAPQTAERPAKSADGQPENDATTNGANMDGVMTDGGKTSGVQ
jgi:hypothetical protein